MHMLIYFLHVCIEDDKLSLTDLYVILPYVLKKSGYTKISKYA